MKKSHETRRHLLEVAAQAIADHGIEKVTTRLLAAKADVSLGLIARYFPKKNDMLLLVVEYVFEETHRILRDRRIVGIRGGDVLIQNVRQNFQIFALERDHYNKCLFLSYCYIGIDQRITDVHVTVIERAIARTADLFHEFAADSGFTLSSEQAMQYARAWMQQLEGGLIHCWFHQTKKARREFADRYIETAHQRLREILSTHGTSNRI